MEKDRYLLSSLNNASVSSGPAESCQQSLLGRTNSFVRNGQSQCISQSVHIGEERICPKASGSALSVGDEVPLLRKLGGGTAGYRDGSSTRPAESDPAVQAGGTPLLPQSGTGLSLFVRRNLPMTFR